MPATEIDSLIAQGVSHDAANAVVAFFKRMAFDVYRAALSDQQASVLRGACVFVEGMPVPRAAIEAAGVALGVARAGNALDRLLGLGLIDDWGSLGGTLHAAANPLARPLSMALDKPTVSRLADAVLPALGDAWRRKDGSFAWDVRAVEVVRLALAGARPDAALLDAAAEGAGCHLFLHHADAQCALDLVLEPALTHLEALGVTPGAGLLRITVDCSKRVGGKHTEKRAITLLQRLAMSDGNDVESAAARLHVARHHHRLGDIDDAEQAFACAVAGFRSCRQEREWAIAHGGVADTLKARGQFDAALKVLREQVLPVFERFDDASAKAVTQGKIADILKLCGELDKALRIHREEELPVHDRLGDLREKVVTLGKIAAILETRGQLDEALALQEQRMPIARRLGDIDSLAHIMFATARLRLESSEHETGGLPQIDGELAEAFAMSVTLSRPDFIAGTGLLLAQVLAMGGQPEPALVVLAQAEKAFAKLDDAVGLAHVRELRATIGGA